MPRKIEISHRTIIFTVFFLLSLWFVFLIKDIIFTIFVSILLMAILNPLVGRLVKWKFPRFLAVFLTYVLVLGVIGFSISSLVPLLVSQTTSLVNSIPVFIESLGWEGFLDPQMMSGFLSQLGTLPTQAVKFGVSVFSNLVSVISVLVFSFYFLLYRGKLNEQLSFIFGEDRKKQVGKIIDEVELNLGSWARGMFILMFFVGLVNYLGLFLLGIPFALPLAIIAGLLEIVPILGPNLAAIIAVIVGLTISPLTALAVAALAFLVQQLENYLLVPKIMEKSVGVNPVVTLLALAIGYRMMGIVGILLSVPLFLTIRVLIKEYFKNR